MNSLLIIQIGIFVEKENRFTFFRKTGLHLSEVFSYHI